MMRVARYDYHNTRFILPRRRRKIEIFIFEIQLFEMILEMTQKAVKRPKLDHFFTAKAFSKLKVAFYRNIDAIYNRSKIDCLLIAHLNSINSKPVVPLYFRVSYHAPTGVGFINSIVLQEVLL